MKPLIAEFAKNAGTISVAKQTASIDATIHRYKASLSAIPTVGKDDIQSIMQLIEIIGNFLQSGQLLESFKAEPASTIEVDDGVSKEILELAGRAVNAGVLIRMPVGSTATSNPLAFQKRVF